MGTVLACFKESFLLLFKDKYIFLFSLIPVLIGIALYSFLGTWIFTELNSFARTWIEGYFGSGFGEILSYLLIGLFSIVFFFITQWTFVIIVALVAVPFNDIISSRVERVVGGMPPESLNSSLKRIVIRFGKTIKNEIKKVLFILLLVVLAFLISFSGVLAPISFIITALSLAIEFLDYSWSRHDLTFRECLSDTKSGFFPYTLAGCIFLFLFGIPIINLITLPVAVIYFTNLYTKRRLMISPRKGKNDSTGRTVYQENFS